MTATRSPTLRVGSMHTSMNCSDRPRIFSKSRMQSHSSFIWLTLTAAVWWLRARRHPLLPIFCKQNGSLWAGMRLVDLLRMVSCCHFGSSWIPLAGLTCSALPLVLGIDISPQASSWLGSRMVINFTRLFYRLVNFSLRHFVRWTCSLSISSLTMLAPSTELTSVFGEPWTLSHWLLSSGHRGSSVLPALLLILMDFMMVTFTGCLNASLNSSRKLKSLSSSVLRHPRRSCTNSQWIFSSSSDAGFNLMAESFASLSTTSIGLCFGDSCLMSKSTGTSAMDLPMAIGSLLNSLRLRFLKVWPWLGLSPHFVSSHRKMLLLVEPLLSCTLLLCLVSLDFLIGKPYFLCITGLSAVPLWALDFSTLGLMGMGLLMHKLNWQHFLLPKVYLQIMQQIVPLLQLNAFHLELFRQPWLKRIHGSRSKHWPQNQDATSSLFFVQNFKPTSTARPRPNMVLPLPLTRRRTASTPSRDLQPQCSLILPPCKPLLGTLWTLMEMSSNRSLCSRLLLILEESLFLRWLMHFLTSESLRTSAQTPSPFSSSRKCRILWRQQLKFQQYVSQWRICQHKTLCLWMAACYSWVTNMLLAKPSRTSQPAWMWVRLQSWRSLCTGMNLHLNGTRLRPLRISPVKCLLQMMPVLRRCTEPQCDLRCGLFHPAVEDDVDQVIIEVWGRRFQSLDSKVLPAPKADMFMTFLRIATPALDYVLKTVADGVYLEPRAAGVKATDSNYAVIWLAGANRETAVHRLKLSVHGLSLVRMKTRFGIRVPARHEEAAHRELRPGDSFLKVNVARVYRLHPLPHGLQRAQLIQLLKDWAWAAKPLQPSRGSAEGGAWEVGSELEPPNSVLQAFNKDVLVSLLRDKKEVDRTPQIIGSNRAQKHLRNQDRPTTAASASTDPWQANPSLDPWKSWRGPTTVQTEAAAKRIDAITATVVTQANDAVRQQLDAAIQNAPTAMDQRIQKLETDMVEIKTHNATVTNWIKETGTRLSNQDDKLNHLNTAMQQQQQDLISVRTELHTSADNLHQAMAQSFGSMKDEISNQVGASMSHHMERFEQLLVGKVPRREWLSPPGPARQVPGCHRNATSVPRFLWIFLVFSQFLSAMALQLPVGFQFVDTSLSHAATNPMMFQNSALWFYPERWGEAQNPGPRSSDLHYFGFSNCNGLRQKEEIALSLGPGVWSFEETYLTRTTQRTCSQRLRCLANQLNRPLRIHFGSPVAPRANSTWAGTWAGVATLSNHPSQEINLPYGESWSPGTCLVASLSWIPSSMDTQRVLPGHKLNNLTPPCWTSWPGRSFLWSRPCNWNSGHL